jgi:hypothetical protein
MLKDIVHNADILAVPCFLIAFIYFYNKQNKTFLEIFLMLFVLSGFIVDSIFTYNYITGKL